MAEAVESVPTMAQPPPIAMLLPLLQPALTWSSLLFRLVIRLLLTALYPLRIVWTVLSALLSPIVVVIHLAFDFALFTPFSIVRAVAVALYPAYVFCVAACLLGAAVGILGHHVSAAILRALSRTSYFKFVERRQRQPPPPRSSSVPPAGSGVPSGPQAMLRKRKRKSVRMQ